MMNAELVKVFFFIIGLWGIASAHADGAEQATRWSLRPGREAAGSALGFGWSYGEGRHRWITELEADVYVDLPESEDLLFQLGAAVAYLPWRTQRIGVFVNNRYVSDWTGAAGPELHQYDMLVPKRYWQSGRNRITLRAAYTTRIGADRRHFALRVESLTLRSP